MGPPNLVCWGTSTLISTVIVQSVFPPAVKKGSFFPTAPSALVTDFLIVAILSGVRENLSVLLNGRWCWTFFRIYLLLVFIWEVCIHHRCSSLDWILKSGRIDFFFSPWVLYMFSIKLLVFWERVSQCSLKLSEPPPSASRVLGWQACTTTLSSMV